MSRASSSALPRSAKNRNASRTAAASSPSYASQGTHGDAIRPADDPVVGLHHGVGEEHFPTRRRRLRESRGDGSSGARAARRRSSVPPVLAQGDGRAVLSAVQVGTSSRRSRRTAGRWTPATSSAGLSRWRQGRTTWCAWRWRSVERAPAAGGASAGVSGTSGDGGGGVPGCRMQFAIEVRRPLPATCPDCGADVLASADIEGPSPPVQPPFNVLRIRRVKR